MGMANLLASCNTTQLKIIISSRNFIEKAKLQKITDELVNNGYKILYLEDVKNEIEISDKLIGLFFCIYTKYLLQDH